MKALRQLHSFTDREQALLREKEAWLRAQGWERSSDYPASLWLWRKNFPPSEIQWVWRDGKKAQHPGFSLNGVSTNVAIQIEAAWLDLWVSGDHAQPAPATREGET